jgi:hypothetical protein
MIVCPVADIDVVGKARSAGEPGGLSVWEVFGGKNFQPDNLHSSRMFLACVEIALFSPVPDGRGRIGSRNVGYRRPV